MGLPTNLTLGGVPVLRGTFANTFATHFHSKVVTNTRKVKVKSTVYNGKCQLIVANRNFMTPDDVKCCLYDLSNKKCEGFDRIPVCSLYDARAVLLKPLSNNSDQKFFRIGPFWAVWQQPAFTNGPY